jgi:6-phosphogluconate dehydrogenase
MQIGLIGFGKMGKMLGDKWLADGHQVILWNRSSDVLQKLRQEKSNYIVSQKLVIAGTIEELHDALIKPRIFWLMLPAGQPTNDMLQKIFDITENGDIVVDGGNSNYKDSEKWYKQFKDKGVKFLGIGVSGGIYALNNGASLMVGGDKEGYAYIAGLLNTLAKPNGAHAYFGEGGAGHFLKMVHNGIEYGMMQSIGEGFGVLSKSEYKLNLTNVAWLWQRGGIIRSFLLAMVMGAFAKDPALTQLQGHIETTGEAEWAIAFAKEVGVPVDIIEKSVDFRKRSQYDAGVQQTFTARLIAAMRREFGGHAVKSK